MRKRSSKDATLLAAGAIGIGETLGSSFDFLGYSPLAASRILGLEHWAEATFGAVDQSGAISTVTFP